MSSFKLPNGTNVWKYTISKENKVTITPSVNFHGGDAARHKPECHYTITDADYIEDYS